MGVYTTRLGCQLSFSEEQESDIIAVIQQLNSTHKTGQFLSNLIRIALECPEVIDKGNGRFEQGALLRHMDACGISYDRRQFMQSVTKEIADMKKKVDSIYDIAMKTYTLALMGKHLGLEEKSNNSLMSTFILERQLKDLQTSLGVNIGDAVYASNKLDESHEKANSALEYIIETYTGIMDELKSKLEPIEIPVQTVVQQQPVQVVQQPVQVPTVVQETVQSGQEATVDTQYDQDEPIDFGESAPKKIVNSNSADAISKEDLQPDFSQANLSAVTSFFGM